MTVFSLDGVSPQFEDKKSNWIAPDAMIIGDVHIHRDAGIWFGAVIRGDNEPIVIGTGTNIQEHTVMHTDMGFPLNVGAGCTIGHRAMLHGCTIGDNSLIGIGAIVMNGAQIGKNSIVGAGALVTEGKQFPDNSLIVGSPARVVREVDSQGEDGLRLAASGYVENGKRFKAGLKQV